MPIPESKVKEIVTYPLDYSGWTIQGLGMLRLHLVENGSERLHIWDPGVALNDQISAHDHAWDFKSTIYFGRMGNQRYVVGNTGDIEVRSTSVQCGVGGFLFGEVQNKLMSEEGRVEIYNPSEAYSMEAEEYHNSYPEAGTVTVIERNFRPARNVANLCWVGDDDWQQEGFTREATREEILHFTGLVALK